MTAYPTQPFITTPVQKHAMMRLVGTAGLVLAMVALRRRRGRHRPVRPDDAHDADAFRTARCLEFVEIPGSEWGTVLAPNRINLDMKFRNTCPVTATSHHRYAMGCVLARESERLTGQISESIH